MTFNKLERQLQLMLLLTQNTRYSVEELGEQLGMSRRTVYRYLDFFRDFGFQVEKTIDGIYRLDKSSSYFSRITKLIHFTEGEAITLKEVLEGVPRKTVAVKQLLEKLSRIYDLQNLEEIKSNEQLINNQQNLHKAMKIGCQCILHNYSSAHSQSLSDRLVEPFAFMDNHTAVRAFEVESHTCKTFKLMRISTVELLEKPWVYSNQHKKLHIDVFNFSGDSPMKITLRLDQLATNLLLEEYNVSPRQLTQEDDNHWIFTTEVCSHKGIGRFCMGLLNSAEVVEGDSLKQYIASQLTAFRNRTVMESPSETQS